MAAHSTDTDQHLFALLKDGNEGAFAEIYQRYYDPLAAQAYKMLKGDEAFQDVLQDVFTNLWKKRDSIEINTSLKGYLFLMLRNAVLREIRQNTRQGEVLDSLGSFVLAKSDSADYFVRYKQMEAVIESEIDRLPGRMREIFLLSRKQDLTQEEIAETLGLSKMTVKNQIHKALVILKERLSYLIMLLIISWFV